MSTAVEKTIPIGPVYAYWNNVRLGSPKTQATVRYSKETIQAGLEDAAMNVTSHKVKETCEVDIVIADLKLSQLRYVYDQAASYTNDGTIRANAFTSTVTVSTFTFKESIRLSGTVATTLARAGYSSIQVWKSDWSAEYTASTDYTSTASNGNVARIGSGAITDLSTVNVLYTQSATASRVTAGGEMADFEAALKLVHELKDGKALMFYAYRAKKIGASDLAIQMAAEFGGEPMTFHCLADMTQPQGQQLFYWAEES